MSDTLGYISGVNSNGYYRKYNNGELETWGTAYVQSNGICTINFPVPYIDTSYRMYATSVYNTGSTFPVTACTVQEDTATRFYIYARELNGTYPPNGAKYMWQVRGRWK